jgi:hypothetical protein
MMIWTEASIHKYHTQVCLSYANELGIIRKQFDQLRRRPLMDYSYPRYAGAALWALQFQRRLKAPMLLLTKAAPYLLETVEGTEIYAQYNQIIASIEQVRSSLSNKIGSLLKFHSQCVILLYLCLMCVICSLSRVNTQSG